MQFAPIRAIVFDFDGTLAQPNLDFHKMNQAAVNAVAALLDDYPPKQEPALEWLARVHKQAKQSHGRKFADTVYQAADEAMAEVEVAAVLQAGLFPGVREMLENLNWCGVKTAIITRNCRKAVETALPDAESLLACVLSRDDISRWKPDPTHLTAALEQMAVAPEAALMVGDDPMDIQVGKKAGTHTAAVFCGHVPKDKLIACKPDLTAENCLLLISQLKAAGLLLQKSEL